MKTCLRALIVVSVFATPCISFASQHNAAKNAPALQQLTGTVLLGIPGPPCPDPLLGKK